MNIQLKATKLELDQETKNYIQEKFDMLEKYLGDTQVLSCRVEVGINSNHHNKGSIYFTHVNLELKGELIRVEKQEEKLFKSIDKVKDHLAECIKKYKEKKIQY
ncbi:ribosome-associated translation inhibitor RaiA [Patescibacteria group bacterium]|nr:ribosome-associated translation inhibitor RaiA [Patescibacteria group bacterium]